MEPEHPPDARDRDAGEAPLADRPAWLDDALLHDVDDEPLVHTADTTEIRETELDRLVEQMNVDRVLHPAPSIAALGFIAIAAAICLYSASRASLSAAGTTILSTTN